MLSPSEGLVSEARIMMLGWFLSKARPLAVVNLMAQGMCGFRRVWDHVCHRLVGSAQVRLPRTAPREVTALPPQMVATKSGHLTFEMGKRSMPSTRALIHSGGGALCFGTESDHGALARNTHFKRPSL